VAAALIFAVLVPFSIAFIDRPVQRLVARYVLSHHHLLLFFDFLASPSLLTFPGACFYFLYFGVCTVLRRFDRLRNPLYLQLCVAIAIATQMKDELKWVFGRPWPGTWMEVGLYKFHPFNNDLMFGSFPSGHTSITAAPMFVLWWCMPKYRPLWLAIIFSVMIGLVGSGHHYVADTIAGFFLGLAVGTGTVAVWPKPTGFEKKQAVPFLKQKNQKDVLSMGLRSVNTQAPRQ